MAKTVEGYSQWFIGECSRAAKAGHARMMSAGGVADGLYLYYRPGELALLASDVPHEGYELGCSERVPGHLTLEQLTGWVHQRATRLGCLPSDGGGA